MSGFLLVPIQKEDLFLSALLGHTATLFAQLSHSGLCTGILVGKLFK